VEHRPHPTAETSQLCSTILMKLVVAFRTDSAPCVELVILKTVRCSDLVMQYLSTRNEYTQFGPSLNCPGSLQGPPQEAHIDHTASCETAFCLVIRCSFSVYSVLRIRCLFAILMSLLCFSLCPKVHKPHVRSVITSSGRETAMYKNSPGIQTLIFVSSTVSLASRRNIGVLNRPETNVPGRKIVVIKARSFMLCASYFVAVAIWQVSSAIF